MGQAESSGLFPHGEQSAERPERRRRRTVDVLSGGRGGTTGPAGGRRGGSDPMESELLPPSRDAVPETVLAALRSFYSKHAGIRAAYVLVAGHGQAERSMSPSS